MDYIVLDLEWNQAQNVKETKDIQFEIIEIGAVKLDENMSEIDRFSEVIKPTVYKKMNHIVEEITGITEETLCGEKKFPEVIREFLNWCGNDYILCTFGSQDLYELQMNMIYHNCDYAWSYPLKYIDVQRIFGIESGDFEHRSLEVVSLYYGLKQDKNYHRALGDAIYTAEIMKRLDRKYFRTCLSLDYVNLPETEKKAKELNLGTHLEYLSVEEENKDEVIIQPRMRITKCPVCMKKCRKKIKWFSDSTKYVCVAFCEEHGYIEGTINLKKRYNGKYFGVKKVFLINDEQYEKVIARKELLREKRRNKRLKARQ